MKWAPKQSLGEKWSMTSKRLRSTGFMHIDHFLYDVDQWQSHNSIWCLFVCVIKIAVDGSIAVLTIAEHVA